MTIVLAVFCGFMFGMILATLMERVQRASSLELSAQAKTAQKINGRFYYIVPEEAYSDAALAAQQEQSK
jgi:hypothetical protein